MALFWPQTFSYLERENLIKILKMITCVTPFWVLVNLKQDYPNLRLHWKVKYGIIKKVGFRSMVATWWPKQNKIDDFVDNQFLSQTSSYSYQKCSKKEKKRTKWYRIFGVFWEKFRTYKKQVNNHKNFKCLYKTFYRFRMIWNCGWIKNKKWRIRPENPWNNLY